jgi:hypothetical protein
MPGLGGAVFAYLSHGAGALLDLSPAAGRWSHPG